MPELGTPPYTLFCSESCLAIAKAKEAMATHPRTVKSFAFAFAFAAILITYLIFVSLHHAFLFHPSMRCGCFMAAHMSASTHAQSRYTSRGPSCKDVQSRASEDPMD